MTSEDSFNLHDLNGISKEIKLRLAEAEIHSLKDIVVRGEMNISEATGLSPSTCKRICGKARSRLEQQGVLQTPFTTAINRQSETISFGSKSLDGLLGGQGVHTKAITELFGESNAGKTQFCHMLCIMVQLGRDQGGLDGKAIYIDTEGTFRSERVEQIAIAKGLDKNKASKNVMIAKPMNCSDQEHFIEIAGSVINEQKNVKLLVIDSVTALYRAEYVGRATLPERQQRLYRHMLMLRRLSEVYRVAVVITNQVNQSPEVFLGSSPNPVGGHVMAHASTFRIKLRQFGYYRIAELIHSSYLPEVQVYFGLSEQGLHDVPNPEPLR